MTEVDLRVELTARTEGFEQSLTVSALAYLRFRK